MSFWAAFWQWLLVIALILFLGLAVIISIGGFFDIRALFRNIQRQHDEQSG